MTGPTIRYNFGSLEMLSTDLKAQFGRLEELSGQLKQQVGAIATHWDSGGAAAYQQAQLDWDRLFSDARLRLNGLGTGVANASNRMAETDQRVGRSFTT